MELSVDSYDESGNQYDGANFGATFVAQGACNGAFDFNGVTSHVRLLDSLATDLDGLNAVTVAAWIFNRGPGEPYRDIIRMDYGHVDAVNTEGLRGIMFRLGGNPNWAGDSRNKFSVVIGTDRFPTKRAAVEYEVIEAIPLDTWTHVAVVYDGSTVTLYVNGVAPAQIRRREAYHYTSVVSNGDPHWGALTTSGSVTTLGAIRRADLPEDGVHHWNGMIDDLRVYNRALSTFEMANLPVCPEPPVADFTKTETVQPGELVTFTDTSTGDITERLWDFGDGTMSTEQDPTHTYDAPGVYTISLTVTGPGVGCLNRP